MYKSDVNSFFLWILKAVLYAVFACSSWPLPVVVVIPQRASLLQGNGSPNHISSSSYVQSMTCPLTLCFDQLQYCFWWGIRSIKVMKGPDYAQQEDKNINITLSYMRNNSDTNAYQQGYQQVFYSFELPIQTILMLMIFAVCYALLKLNSKK